MYALAAVVLLGVVAVSQAARCDGSAGSADNRCCFACEILVNELLREDFMNQIHNANDAKAALERACDRVGVHFEDAATCRMWVDANYMVIYDLVDMAVKNHTRPHARAICVSINECPQQAKFAFARSERGWLCSACEEVFKEIDQLLPSAEGLTEEALKVFLDGLCDEVPFVSGILKDLVNKYLDDIFHYIEEHGTINAEGICNILHCC